MSTASEGTASFDGDVGDANSVLLLVPSMEPADDECCAELLWRGDVEDKNVLSVTLTDSPDDRMAAWDVHADGQPAETAFVDVGDRTRSVAAKDASIEVPGRDITIETVSSPGDLTGMGMRVSEILSRWAGDGNEVVVCFHSLTALLQFVDLQRAFQFLHVLTARIDNVGATSHFHMDPTAHDERDINTLTSLFDAVVAFEDGEWTVRSR